MVFDIMFDKNARKELEDSRLQMLWNKRRDKDTHDLVFEFLKINPDVDRINEILSGGVWHTLPKIGGGFRPIESS